MAAESWEEACKKAVEKFYRLGPLGVTADDHKAISSTPPEEFSDFDISQLDKRGS